MPNFKTIFKPLSKVENSHNDSDSSRSVEEKTIVQNKVKGLTPISKTTTKQKITTDNARREFFQETTTTTLVNTNNSNFLEDFKRQLELESGTDIYRITGDKITTRTTFPNKINNKEFTTTKTEFYASRTVIPKTSTTSTSPKKSTSPSSSLASSLALKSADYKKSVDNNKQFTDHSYVSPYRINNNHNYREYKTIFQSPITQNLIQTKSPPQQYSVIKPKLNLNSTPDYKNWRLPAKTSSSLTTPDYKNHNLRLPAKSHSPLMIVQGKSKQSQRPLSNSIPKPHFVPPPLTYRAQSVPNLKRKLGPGKLFIFHHDEFEDKKNEYRQGSKLDVELLKKTFRTFNVNTYVYNNYTVKQIRAQVTKLSNENFNKNSCIIIAILTHGNRLDVVAAKDGNYSIDDDVLFPILCNKTLATKPKIVIVQACKGDVDLRSYQTDSAQNLEKKLIPDEIYKFYSTSEGCVSFRNITGSVFIQSFCEEMTQSGYTKSIRDIMDAVTKKVKNRTRNTQIPSMCVNNTETYIFGNYLK